MRVHQIALSRSSKLLFVVAGLLLIVAFAAAPAGAATSTPTISASGTHSCGVKTDGTPFCWGGNYQGESAVPAGLGKVTQISAGESYGCAIRIDGTPACWGNNDRGWATVPEDGGALTQIDAGYGTTCAIKADGTPICWGDMAGQTVPADIGTVTQISAGYYNGCAIKTDGTLACWGYSPSGMTDIPDGLGTVTQVSDGGTHACAIKTDGTPVCWGDDQYGKRTVPEDLGTVTQISADMFHTCAIKTNGTPVCWGDNAYNMSSIPAGTGTVTQIAAGMYHTCVVKTNGTTVCWGYGGFNSVPYPDGARTAPIKISAGALYTCAVKGDGTPTCWGDNGSGQSSIPDGTGTVTQMVAGVNHSCAIRTDGTPTCWGNNDSGQSSIPDGTGTVTQIIAGNNFTCAIKTNGNPTCWGANDVGETAIPAGIGTVKQIAAGFSTSCAIKTDGTPVCWGDGENGQTAIPGDIGAVTQIAVGDWHVCAIKADGTPVCWGSNYFGQLNIPAGIGTVTQLRSDDFHTCAVTVDSHAVCWGTDYWGQSTVPDGIDTVSQVAAGFYHSCVVETSGQAKCWGYNGYGQSGGPATFSSADPSATIQMEDYSFTFTAGGGPGATFDLASGNLPPGLALSSTGALTGTPTTRGTYTFTVRASNGIFADGAQEVTLKVEAPTPSAPTLHSTYPDSPSNATEIAIIGDAQPDSTVKLYASDDCTGSPVATDTAWNYDFWLWVTVGADTSTSFTAIATNPDDKTSPCSSVITYVNDSTAPTAPTALAIVPDSPSQSADVTISGGAESGSTVNLYANAECSGYPVQTGDASDFADGFTVTAPSDASTFFTANASDAAGNTSGCSSAVSYTNDSTAPDAPSALSASPVSPSASAAVTIKGVAEAGTSVDLYDNSTCSGSPVETGDANAFATGFAVTATLNAETAYAVTATDAAGNTSECSDAVLFVNDSTPPPAPFAIAIEPKSPANPSALKVSGHADGGTTVRLYANASCSGAPAATGTAADFATGFETTATSNMSVYAATATDGVGNTSPCSSAAGFEVLKSGTFVKPTLKTKHKGSRLIFSASIRLSGAGISPETCLGTVKAVLQRSRGNKAFPSSTTKSGLAKLGWNGSACVAKLSVSKSARYTTKGVKVKTTLSVHSPSLAVPPMVFVKKF